MSRQKKDRKNSPTHFPSLFQWSVSRFDGILERVFRFNKRAGGEQSAGTRLVTVVLGHLGVLASLYGREFDLDKIRRFVGSVAMDLRVVVVVVVVTALDRKILLLMGVGAGEDAEEFDVRFGVEGIASGGLFAKELAARLAH